MIKRTKKLATEMLNSITPAMYIHHGCEFCICGNLVRGHACGVLNFSVPYDEKKLGKTAFVVAKEKDLLLVALEMEEFNELKFQTYLMELIDSVLV